MKINRILIPLALLLFFGSVRANAQTQLLSQEVTNLPPWYIGAKGGTAFGVSTFSSFGADKTRWGVGGDVFGGYRLNKVFSVELSAGYSSLSMSIVDKGCENLWLSSDRLRYHAPIVGEDNWRYGDLYSSASLFNVGAHLNVSLLPAFGVKSRFRVDVSPAIYWASSWATVKKTSGNQTVLKGGTNSHFGAGADLTLGYRVSNSIAVGIYGGGVWYSGNALDAMPRVEHKGNYTFNTGIKLTYSFGGKNNSRKSIQTPVQSVTAKPQVTDESQISKVQPVESSPEKPEATQDKVTVEVVSQQVAEKKEELTQTVAPTQLLPTVYFGFNEVLIPESEMSKLRQIADVLNANPTMMVELQGWCDKVGTRRSIMRVSLLRAVELRYRLIKLGVSGDRLTVKAMGEDTSADSVDKARRVETIEKQTK